MTQTDAERQASFRRRRSEREAALRAEVESLRRPSNHVACDQLERELRAEIARLRALQGGRN